MKPETPKQITTNTNQDDKDKLNADSDSPWESNPADTNEPEITITLPDDATITDVALVNAENVEKYIVTVGGTPVCNMICLFT
jgi:alcohol dehydrogenase YqhD (iron-dependent ADH family)